MASSPSTVSQAPAGPPAPTGSVDPPRGADHVAPDCRGMNFFRHDRAFRDLLGLYMDEVLYRHLEGHFDRLGGLAGGRLDRLADIADKNPPVLRPRDRFGRDEDWIDYHPAYREMEQIAYGEFGLHAMSHRGGVLGWPEPMPPIAKYGFQYLFVQGEFGLMCPVSVSDTCNFIILKYGDDALKARLVPRLLSQDMDRIWKGTQFITEQAGGSDVGRIETVARRADGVWRLYGEKWFCSHADADLALLLARPEGAGAGTGGLGLFAMPRRLEDGSRNAYRIVRLKDKLGTRSMASGEIRLDGALAYPVGRLEHGFKQMMDQVNLSRLSHGVRAAAMMRRCLNEALQAARGRIAFGRPVLDHPLARRQMLKLLVPTEQALSFYGYTAHVMAAADRGEPRAGQLLRILTPLYKFRACRDNLGVATGAMEMRGGNGYIEDWVNPRLVRDAHIGVLWEGTSTINALDVITRAIAKLGADRALAVAGHELLAEATAVPGQFRSRLGGLLDRAVRFAREVAADPAHEKRARLATGALYHAISAVLMTWEAARLGAAGGDARRLLVARLVIEHRLGPTDPMAIPADAWEEPAAALLFADAPVPLARAAELAVGG